MSTPHSARPARRDMFAPEWSAKGWRKFNARWARLATHLRTQHALAHGTIRLTANGAQRHARARRKG